MILELEFGGQKFQVKYTNNPHEITNEIKLQKPKFITYDTETTGLHIKKDRPFLAAVCFNNVVFVFPATKEFISHLWDWSRLTRRIFGHNVTFDMHMSANVVGEDFIKNIKNWGDTMCLGRLTFEAVSTRHGGDSLALTRIGKKYIDPNADVYEKQVKAWLKAKKASNRKLFIAMLNGIVDEGGRWTLKRFEEAMNEGASIPTEVWETYQNWKKNYPEPTYQDVPMDIILPYVATDVILTKILVDKALPVVVHKKQVDIMMKEFRLINTIFKMERRGLKVDRDYLKEVNSKLERYIADLYTKLHLLADVEFTVGQHEKIKDILEDILDERPSSTDKAFLKKLESGDNERAAELAKIITTLRRLEKWKATYVEKILKDSEYDGRFYTQLNPYNPISGRFSGDAQQFPKDPIFDEEGNEIYHPRKAFIGTMYYIDYSQVELRVQAHYTLPFGGDLQLCRAYMPYKCVHYKTGEEYSFETVESRRRWKEFREGYPKDLHWEDILKQGWSVWVNPDTGDYWIPTDVHSQTTEKALKIIGDMQGKDFKWWRNIGKRFNFMRLYGGGDFMAAEVLDIPIEHARAMNRGFTEAFPLVVTYQDNVIKTMRTRGFVTNLFGRRYYVSNWNKHYTCGNYLIQGSCADMLKNKMIEIDDYLEKHNLWDKLVMVLCVHDEIQFENVTGDRSLDKHILAIQKIMEDTTNIKVPIVAEIDFTETSWADAKPLKLKEEV